MLDTQLLSPEIVPLSTRVRKWESSSLACINKIHRGAGGDEAIGDYHGWFEKNINLCGEDRWEYLLGKLRPINLGTSGTLCL